MTSAVVTCVHAGRRVKKNTQRRQETTGQGTDTQRIRGEEAVHGVHKKNHLAKQRQYTARGLTALSEQAAGERIGAIGA